MNPWGDGRWSEMDVVILCIMLTVIATMIWIVS